MERKLWGLIKEKVVEVKDEVQGFEEVAVVREILEVRGYAVEVKQ